MKLRDHKTKIVCTIGPASESREVMEKLIEAGMDVARLNLSHGSFEVHSRIISDLRAAAQKIGRRLAIMTDLPGPKMRIREVSPEPVELQSGDLFTLTSDDVVGDKKRVSVTFADLPKRVKKGDNLFLNDGFIQLQVESVSGTDVQCRVVVGGELRSRKGLNLPGIDLGISAFTDDDYECLKFAVAQGVDAVSQSFVESAADIEAVRKAAKALGGSPFIIAKIERSKALKHIDSILEAADGIMIARGDLGVEMPIEQMALVQKNLMRQANLAGKPIITATQMLESMTVNSRPTRAEATDVANAILDGTDCIMLSGESAMGKYPVEAVTMLAKIASAIEGYRTGHYVRKLLKASRAQAGLTDVIALNVENTLERIQPAAVFVPTRGGHTPRSITRFRLPVWIVAVSSQESTCQGLQFSYGVQPVYEGSHPENWKAFIEDWLTRHEIRGRFAVLTEGPSSKYPDANHRLEIVKLES